MTEIKQSRRELMEPLGGRRQRVRAYSDRGYSWVQWTDPRNGKRRFKRFAGDAKGERAAIGWAKRFHAKRSEIAAAGTRRITLRALWDAYKGAEFASLREASRTNYTDGWTKWETFAGPRFLVDDTTQEMLDEFKAELLGRGLSHRYVRTIISTVKRVYAWGERRKLVTRNELHLWRWKQSRDVVESGPGEYRNEDFRLIVAQLDPTKLTQWRPFVALSLCGYQGRRQTSVLHLSLTDINLTDAPIAAPEGSVAREIPPGSVLWRSRWDKMGKESITPIRAGARKAIEIALGWRQRGEYAGPWLIPSGSSKNASETYTIQSLWSALRTAEDRAGIRHEKGRAGHSLRRMLAGDVNALTGDATLALQAIGDSDIRQAKAYLKPREDRVADAFAALDAAETEDANK